MLWSPGFLISKCCLSQAFQKLEIRECPCDYFFSSCSIVISIFTKVYLWTKIWAFNWSDFVWIIYIGSLLFLIMLIIKGILSVLLCTLFTFSVSLWLGILRYLFSQLYLSCLFLTTGTLCSLLFWKKWMHIFVVLTGLQCLKIAFGWVKL